MRLNSLSSGFSFNLPSDFIPSELVNQYTELLEKNWVQYDNVVDYLSSTIKEVSIPGLSIEAPTQIRKRGKEVNYKPATNVQDILTRRQADITFRSVDGDVNYFILYDIFIKHYLDTRFVKYVEPFTVHILDIHRDNIYDINLREIILLTHSENQLSYNDTAFGEKTFTLTINFNWIDIDFLLTDTKVLELNDTGGSITITPQYINDYDNLKNKPPNQNLPNGEKKS